MRSWKCRITAVSVLGTSHHAKPPAVLDHSRTLPQGDGSTRPALAGGEEGGERDLIVLDAGDVLDDAFAVRCPSIDAEGKVSSQLAHLRPLLPHSSSSRFTAGASDDLAEVHGLDFPGAWVKHSPPKRLRNASAVAVSGKQNRIRDCSASCRLRPRRTGMRRSRWNASI